MDSLPLSITASPRHDRSEVRIGHRIDNVRTIAVKGLYTQQEYTHGRIANSGARNAGRNDQLARQPSAKEAHRPSCAGAGPEPLGFHARYRMPGSGIGFA